MFYLVIPITLIHCCSRGDDCEFLLLPTFDMISDLRCTLYCLRTYLEGWNRFNSKDWWYLFVIPYTGIVNPRLITQWRPYPLISNTINVETNRPSWLPHSLRQRTGFLRICRRDLIRWCQHLVARAKGHWTVTRHHLSF